MHTDAQVLIAWAWRRYYKKNKSRLRWNKAVENVKSGKHKARNVIDNNPLEHSSV